MRWIRRPVKSAVEKCAFPRADRCQRNNAPLKDGQRRRTGGKVEKRKSDSPKAKGASRSSRTQQQHRSGIRIIAAAWSGSSCHLSTRGRGRRLVGRSVGRSESEWRWCGAGERTADCQLTSSLCRSARVLSFTSERHRSGGCAHALAHPSPATPRALLSLFKNTP